MMKTSLLAKCLPVAFLLSCGAAVESKTAVPKKDVEPQSTKIAGNACTKDEDCITNELCDPAAKACSPICTEDKDCKDGLVCVDTEEKMFCGKNVVECEEDLDCDAGKICDENSKCKTPRCAPLGKDVCPTGYGCLQGACVKQQNNNTCMNAGDCNTVASCKTDKCDCVANKCQQKPVATTCTTANASTVCKADEFCDNGACKPSSTKTCAADTECPTLFYCPVPQVPGSARTCAPGCKDDTECAAGGNVCDKSKDPHACVSPSTLRGPPCRSDQECSASCVTPDKLAFESPSSMVCDYSWLDDLNGTPGQCVPRCTQNFEALGTPGFSCPDSSYSCDPVSTGIPINPGTEATFVSLSKTGDNCGWSFGLGYSACHKK